MLQGLQSPFPRAKGVLPEASPDIQGCAATLKGIISVGSVTIAVITIRAKTDARNMSNLKKNRREVVIRIEEAKMVRLRKMAEEREMTVAALLSEVIMLGFIALKGDKPKIDPYATLDIDPEIHI